MSDTNLKLIEAVNEPVDVLPFERRHDRRRPTQGRVTALRTASPLGDTNRICPLQLLNMSDSGMGAVVQEPLEIGSSLAVYFPAHGPDHGFDLFGHVVRCQRRANGHEIGIRFDALAAA